MQYKCNVKSQSLEPPLKSTSREYFHFTHCPPLSNLLEQLHIKHQSLCEHCPIVVCLVQETSLNASEIKIREV